MFRTAPYGLIFLFSITVRFCSTTAQRSSAIVYSYKNRIHTISLFRYYSIMDLRISLPNPLTNSMVSGRIFLQDSLHILILKAQFQEVPK